MMLASAGHDWLDVGIGTVIDGTYRVCRALGQGSMGVVLLAEDNVLGRLVAIKFVSMAEAQTDPRVLDDFRREAAAMATVQHPNVVQVFAFGAHAGFPYFVMEYIEGTTLRKLIDAREPLPVDVAIGVLQQVCAGLDAVHSAGFVHRDVKPDNVLLGPRYRVALSDFGVVELRRPATSEADFCGTPQYMAPEVVQGRVVPDGQRHQADIYALGCVAFELLTGALPFEATNIAALLEMHVARPAPLLTSIRPDLPPVLDPVIDRALKKSPADRYPNCASFIEALSRARHLYSRAGNQLRILVVDDDEDILALYRVAFEAGLDGEVVCAEDGLTAFELAKAQLPDLIVIDLNIPNLNGLELCAAIKGHPRLSSTPMVVISAMLSPETRAVLADLGVDEAVAKPVQPRQLVNVAKRHLRLEA